MNDIDAYVEADGTPVRIALSFTASGDDRRRHDDRQRHDGDPLQRRGRQPGGRRAVARAIRGAVSQGRPAAPSAAPSAAARRRALTALPAAMGRATGIDVDRAR